MVTTFIQHNFLTKIVYEFKMLPENPNNTRRLFKPTEFGHTVFKILSL